MNPLKKIFTSVTGYWIHKVSTLPVGTNLFIDIHKRIGYGPLKTIFDVGANTGQTWEYFRKEEKKAKIYCFEPIGDTYEVLNKNTVKDNKCICERIALGDNSGEKKIRIFGNESSELNSLKEDVMNSDKDAQTEIILEETLDNYCMKDDISSIDLLKIDTEGYEINVLKGGLRMLKEKKVSFIYAEVGFSSSDNRHTHFEVLNSWLFNYGYYFFGIYQLISNGWKEGQYFGNALFVRKDIFS